MKNTSHEKVGLLLDFISENQGLSDEEIRNDLIADNVNVDGFLARVQQTVRRGIQSKIRENIAQQKESEQAKNHIMPKDITSWSRKKCLEFIESLRNGDICCDVGQRQVALAFRNKQQQQISDDELRSCIKDILSLRNKDENR